MEDEKTPIHVDTWKKMAELGWMGLIVPTEYGGTGLGFLDLAVLLEEMGRACLIAPFFTTVMSAFPILEAGTEEQKRELLPKLARGEAIFTLAFTEPSATYEARGIATTAIRDTSDFVINGTKLFVHDAGVADYLIVVARTNDGQAPEAGITLFIVDRKSPGITVRALPTIGDDRQSEVEFSNVIVPASRMLGGLDQGWQAIARYLERAAVGKCAEMLGGSDWLLEACLEYAKTRVQYGKPIGAFQVIQHYLADMWTEIGLTRQLVSKAAWDIEQGLPCAADVAMAKAGMSDGYKRWTAKAVQIHGAIGVTREFDMGLYFRRARQAAVLFGTADYWREEGAIDIGLKAVGAA